MSRIKRPFSKEIVASSALGIGLIITCVSMQLAFKAGNKNLTLVFGICSAVLCIGACLSIFLSVLGHVDRTKARARELRQSRGEGALGNYKAQHSFKDRLVFALLTIGSGLLCAFLLARNGHPVMKTITIGMFIFCFATTYRYFFTTVLFADQSICVKVNPFVNYSESYKSVISVQERPQSILVQFADGRSLALPTGMGDPERIMSILRGRIRNPMDTSTTSCS